MSSRESTGTNIELSLNEKKVLQALAELGGEARPDEIIENILPESMRGLVDAVRNSLGDILMDHDLKFGDAQINNFITDLMKIKKGEGKDTRAATMTTLLTHITPIIVNQDVPIQRKIIGRALGEVLPLLEKTLTAAKGGEGHPMTMVEVMNSGSWLRSKGLIEITEGINRSYSLSSKRLADMDLPERRALKLIDKNHGVLEMGALKESRKLKAEEIPIAMGWLKRKGWAKIDKRGGATVLEMTAEGRNHLTKKGADELLIEKLGRGELDEGQLDADAIRQLKSRQEFLVEKETITRSFKMTEAGKKLVDAGLDLDEEISQLTPDMIRTGEWKSANIRPYDLDAFAPDAMGGRIHPLQQFIDKIRMIFLEMGFTEIEGDYVQSAFWNMDALFTAQDHPVREMQDTLYLKDPKTVRLPDETIVASVKKMHEEGDDLSDGWGYIWQKSEAEKALLRTHTTVNTIKYLAENPDGPLKVFSIGRVFRKESVDATHLPEFIQVEGIVMEEGASLEMLVGLLKEFYRKMGVENLRLRPGYFPYTEPSIEPEIFHNGQWMELGGSGIFRPEVVTPFGVKHPVLAWGLGLERLAMATLGVKDIRKLYVSDIEWLRSSPLIE